MKIIKKTPYTLKGVECLLVQVLEQKYSGADCCNFCIFSQWDPGDNVYWETCADVHSCGVSSPTFFQVIPLDPTDPQL